MLEKAWLVVLKYCYQQKVSQKDGIE